MGFNSYHNSTPNPAQKYYKWSGGYKEKVTLPDGSTADKITGRLTYWDRDAGENGENVDVPLPFSFCVLEQTRAITGFSPTPGANIRYYSNETVDTDEAMVVKRKDENGETEIVRGRYADIKEKLPQGARLQVNLYIYNPESQAIERINLSGSALGEFINFSKKNKGIYEAMMSIDKSGELKKNGAVEFMPPKFSLASARYSNDEMAELTKQDKIVVDYMKYRREQNEGSNSNSEFVGSIDQTPAQYAGEENQETGGAGDDVILEDDIPF